MLTMTLQEYTEKYIKDANEIIKRVARYTTQIIDYTEIDVITGRLLMLKELHGEKAEITKKLHKSIKELQML